MATAVLEGGRVSDGTGLAALTMVAATASAIGRLQSRD
jgi:hypothetical protein